MAYVQKLAAMYEKEPDNEMIFGQLSNFYSLMGMTKEFDALVEAKIAKNPNDFTAWALKGQALMNRNTTAANPDWKGCVEAFKKAVSIDQTNPVVYTYLGFSMNAMAALSTQTVHSNSLSTRSLWAILTRLRNWILTVKKPTGLILCISATTLSMALMMLRQKSWREC